MNNIFKDKKILIGLAVVALVAVLAGGFFVLSNKSASTGEEAEEEEQILSLSADEIGLSLEMGEEGKEVIMMVDKVDDITSIEYELSYTSEGDIPRGAIGTVEVDGKPVKKAITLGTCSDVCHYDEGVSNIKIILKVTKTDGKAYQVEKSLEE